MYSKYIFKANFDVSVIQSTHTKKCTAYRQEVGSVPLCGELGLTFQMREEETAPGFLFFAVDIHIVRKIDSLDLFYDNFSHKFWLYNQ